MTRYGTTVATGRYLPEIEISHDLLRERFAHLPGFVDKMEASTCIRKRRHAPEDWATSDVALPAARQALERAGRKPEDVALIILGTDSADYITPATSAVLQHKLGARNAGSFDIGCACASFPTGLAAAAGLVASNPSLRTVLVVGVYLRPGKRHVHPQRGEHLSRRDRGRTAAASRRPGGHRGRSCASNLGRGRRGFRGGAKGRRRRCR